MIQLKLRLLNDLQIELQKCDALWVAVAMISDRGFSIIQEHIEADAKQSYLVGVGLPTSPDVLRCLKDNEKTGLFRTRVYHKPDELFHPKVYILRTDERMVAFLGSGNCTEGGLLRNVELSVKIDDQKVCKDLLKWFETTFKFGRPITDDFIERYKSIFERRRIRVAEDNADLNTAIMTQTSSVDLDKMDFSNQFFKRHHFAAFEGNKPWSVSDAVNQERMKVRNQLFKLHSRLYPEIQKKGWDLHEHYAFDDTVSSAIHSSFTSEELGGMWLHYGRSKPAIKAFGDDQTPLDFMRLQIIIHKDNVGIWNRIGKNSGSRIDREYFKSKMSSDEDYRKRFFKLVSSLPDEYFIRMNNELRYVREFGNERQLAEFVSADDIKYYFIIGIEFLPDDPGLSEQTIVSRIIENFELLYPIYDLMKFKFKF